MKQRYYFEAERRQWEKPTEQRYVFDAPARADVIAESMEEATVLAEKKLHDFYDGSGIILNNIRFVMVKDLPANWSYGYNEDLKSGSTAEIGDLTVGHVIR